MAAVVAKARVEEPGVVRAELAGRGVVSHHLRRVVRRNADALSGDKEIELFGLEDDAVSLFRVNRLPIVLPFVGPDLREVNRQAGLPRAKADDRPGAGSKVEAKKEAVGDRDL